MEIDFELAKCGKIAPCAVGTGGGFFPEKLLKKRSWLTQLGRVVDGEGHVFDQETAEGKQLLFAQNKSPGRSQSNRFLKNKDGGTAMAAAKRRTTVVAMLMLRATVFIG